MTRGYRKGRTKVTVPRTVSAPRLFSRPKASRVYTKGVLQSDPLDFANIGFGDIPPKPQIKGRR